MAGGWGGEAAEREVGRAGAKGDEKEEGRADKGPASTPHTTHHTANAHPSTLPPLTTGRAPLHGAAYADNDHFLERSFVEIFTFLVETMRVQLGTDVNLRDSFGVRVWWWW
jgi:hypothetical protein